MHLFKNFLSTSDQDGGAKNQNKLPIINYSDLFTEGGDNLYKLKILVSILKSTAKDKRLEHLHNPILEGFISSAMSDTWSNELISNRDLLLDIIYAILSHPRPKKLSYLFLLLIQIIISGFSRGHAAVISALEQYRLQTKQKLKFTPIRKALAKMPLSDSTSLQTAENALYFFAVVTDRQYFHAAFSGAVWDICYSSVIDQILRLFSGVKEGNIRVRRDVSLKHVHRIKENLREGGINMDVSLLNAVCGQNAQSSVELKADSCANSPSASAIRLSSNGEMGHIKVEDITSLLGGDIRSDKHSQEAFCGSSTVSVVAPSAAAIGKDLGYLQNVDSSEINKNSDVGVNITPGDSAKNTIGDSQNASNTVDKEKVAVRITLPDPPPPPKAEFGSFIKSRISKTNVRGIQWTTLEKKEVAGSIWDDNYALNVHSDGNNPLSLKRCDIERDLRSNGTIREIEEWFSRKREVPVSVSRMSIAEYRKKSTLPQGLDSRKAVNISVVMRSILRNHAHDDVLELIRHGNLGLIGVEVVDNLLAAVSYIDSEMKQKLLLQGRNMRIPDDIETYRCILLIPNINIKLQSMRFMYERSELTQTIEKDIHILRNMLSYIVGPKFLQIMKTILVLGNHINKLNSANTAAGIRLSSVKKIAEFRSNSGEPFMKLLTKVIESNYPDSLQPFNDQEITSKLSGETVDFLSHCMEELRKGQDIISSEIDWQMGAMHSQQNSCHVSRIFLNKLLDTRKSVNHDLRMINELHFQVEKQVSEVVTLYKEARQSFGLTEILDLLGFFSSEFKKYSKSKFSDQEVEYIRGLHLAC